jgi:hypothetical protein
MTMTDIKSNRCRFCPYNNPSWAEICEQCGGVTLPTRNKGGKVLAWKVYSFGSIRTPDSERNDMTSFRGCLENLMGRTETAIHINDGFWLVHYSKGHKRYSIKHEKMATRTYTLDEGGEPELLFQIIEQILDGGKINYSW